MPTVCDGCTKHNNKPYKVCDELKEENGIISGEQRELEKAWMIKATKSIVL